MDKIALLVSELFSNVYTVSADRRRLTKHRREGIPENLQECKGMTGLLGEKRFWLYRDGKDLWLSGEQIDPILIDAGTTASLSNGKPRHLIVTQSGQALLSVRYYPEEDPLSSIYDFTAASMDDERGDFGKSIHRILTMGPDRSTVWTSAW